MSKIFHPLLALIASATNKEPAKYVEYLKHENKILRARVPKKSAASSHATKTNVGHSCIRRVPPPSAGAIGGAVTGMAQK